MTLQASLYYNRERRRDLHRRQSFSQQFALGNVAAGGASPNLYTLLDSIEVGISFSVPTAINQLMVTTNSGRTLGTPILMANEIHLLGFLEKGITLRPSCSIPGTVNLYIFDNRQIIATGRFL